MKIRLGFITNSSSTNHIIMWKGDKYDLKRLLLEKISIFPTNFSGYAQNYHVDKSEILDAILSMIERSLDKSSIQKELAERLEYAERWYKESIQDKRPWGTSWAEEEVKFTKELISLSEDKDWMLEISFGDNEGCFAGGDLGYVMDYAGRNIDVEEDELAYKTEQNR